MISARSLAISIFGLSFELFDLCVKISTTRSS
jgi:hypothetical protein